MFIGVDGTGPGNDAKYNDRMRGIEPKGPPSFVWRIFTQTQEKNKRYLRGPTNLGGEVQSIAMNVRNLVLQFKREGDNRVFLAGWSRGAAICVLAAQALANNKEFSGTIDCLALFDAVDRAAGSPDVIPSNVSHSYHAVRDPAVRSWEGNSDNLEGIISFGNTAQRAANPASLELRHFFATHAGVGGVPWTGDHPALLGLERTTIFGVVPGVKPVMRPTITEAQDRAGSEQVQQWMWARMRRHGMVP